MNRNRPDGRKANTNSQPTGYAAYQQTLQAQQPQAPQGGYAQSPYQGPYAQPGYQQPQQVPGYPQGQSAVPPQQGGYTGYQGYQGYQAPQGGYQQGGPMPQGGYQQPPYQGPYAQPAYQQPYAQQNPNPYAQQGQNPYAQQGQNPYAQQPQAPYPPQPRTPYQRPRRRNPIDPMIPMLIALVVSVILGLLAVVTGNDILRWVFVVSAVIVMILLWVRNWVQNNIRVTGSVLLAVLLVITLVGLVSPPADSVQPTAPAAGTDASAFSVSQTQPEVLQSESEDVLQAQALSEGNADPVVNQGNSISEAEQQLQSFFYFWSSNNQDNMITLCAPSWQRSVEEPKKALFSILANRIPTEWHFDGITGTDNDSSRTITTVATIDRRNNKGLEIFRFSIIMVKEDEAWYVDPNSLKSNEKESPTPTAPLETPTQIPVATGDPNLVLYYNPKGGERYHVDAYCISAAAKNLPFSGTFLYSQLDEEPYASLVACSICGAPLRGE